MMPWRSFIARTGTAAGLFGLALFAAIRLASADPGGPTTSHFTYAGVLRNADGALPVERRTTTLSFTFTNVQRSTTCGPVTTPPVTIAAGGAFTADVPLGPCANFFDGSDITYAITEAGTTLTPDGGAPITPVPYARFADQAGNNNDCPAGYALVSSSGGLALCNRTFAGGRDEVVKVGRGATAFWVDRYEAAVSTQTGAIVTSYAVLEDNGQWAAAPAGSRESLMAVSRPNVTPSTNVTWFQARALCRASGKRLMTRDEWFAAADGMTRVETSTTHNCNVSNTPAGPRMTGMGDRCASTWGAHDMVGNLWEWTDEWYAGVGALTALPPSTGSAVPNVSGRRVNDAADVWPPTYGGDRTWNISSVVSNTADNQIGIPSAAIRGGNWSAGTQAGVFSLYLGLGPSGRDAGIGFRCVSPG